jgi:hexosaminidase
MYSISFKRLVYIGHAIFFLSFIVIGHAQEMRIIPQPQEIQFKSGTFLLSQETILNPAATGSENTAAFLQEAILEHFDLNLPIESTPNKVIKQGINLLQKSGIPEAGYELHISNAQVSLWASSPAGWFYGVQSLMQLWPDSLAHGSLEITLPAVDIKDAPRFSWRAFMLDEGRYFKGKEQVKMLLDEIAYLKMNTFHWHLTDDQGWRIEIKKYPKLTEIGSKRKSTQIGPLKWQSPVQSAEPHEGYYTQEDIKEIVKYAQDRHIQIVPEIEMPGHSSAAIAAYPWLGTRKEANEVPIKFGVGTDVYDVSDPQVLSFLNDVLDEVMQLFPGNVIHIGGDEVKYDHWKSSQQVQAYMTENNLSSPADLQIFFTNGISEYIASKGKRMMGWNEIMGHNLHDYQEESDTEANQKLAQSSIVHFWKGDLELATLAAQNGYEIVNSLHSSTYLDYDYKSIPLAAAYAFDPIPEDLDPEYHSKILGSGCQMWGEWIPTDGEMHFMVFPRIAAYAEVGWTQKEDKNFESFKQGLKSLEQRWAKKEIYFAPDAYTQGE